MIGEFDLFENYVITVLNELADMCRQVICDALISFWLGVADESTQHLIIIELEFYRDYCVFVIKIEKSE